MINLNKIISKNPYSLNKVQKKIFIKKNLLLLDKHHYSNCKNYKKLINIFSLNNKDKKLNIEDFKMLPVKIFKKFDLLSVDKKMIVKELISSGTTGQKVSKIFLDKENSKNQMKVLTKIVENKLGNERLPMLIIDKKPSITNRSFFNAKSAAIFGFSLFGKNYCYLINEKNEIDYKQLNLFIKKFSDKKFLIFGFTSLIYKYLIIEMNNNLKINFDNGILLHGGGWKKLENKKISSELFKKKLQEKLNLKKVFNYYGMVEQTGSIFIECNHGYFHTTIFSDIFIRDHNFAIQNFNKKGLIQLISLIPSSYPGHNIITEDIGEIKGDGDCKCGLNGKYFLVHGRAKEAEIRGCSDAG